MGGRRHPTAQHSGESDDDGYCGLAGSSVPFSAADLSARYPTPTAYTDAIAARAAAAVQAGHLLSEDAAEILTTSQGGATKAAIAELATPAAAAEAASAPETAGSRSTADASEPAASRGSDRVSAAAASHAERGWLATTGRDLITPVLIGLLLLINGRVVLTVAHQRRGARRDGPGDGPAA